MKISILGAGDGFTGLGLIWVSLLVRNVRGSRCKKRSHPPPRGSWLISITLSGLNQILVKSKSWGEQGVRAVEQGYRH